MKDLILSAHDLKLRERHDKKFLFDIVANGINGIDVDKCADGSLLCPCKDCPCSDGMNDIEHPDSPMLSILGM